MKTIKFEGKTWKGSVVLHDPLTIEQEAAWEYALAAYDRAVKDGGMLSAQHAAFLPGIFACVKEWKLKGFPEGITPDTFPSRPRIERAELLALLVKEVSDIYKAGDDPNE